MLNQTHREILNDFNFNISRANDNEYLVSGDKIYFNVSIDNPIEEIIRFAKTFDPENSNLKDAAEIKDTLDTMAHLLYGATLHEYGENYYNKVEELADKFDCDLEAIQAIGGLLDDHNISLVDVELKYDGNFYIKCKDGWSELDVIDYDTLIERIAEDIAEDPFNSFDYEEIMEYVIMDDNSKADIKAAEIEYKVSEIKENIEEYTDEDIFIEDDDLFDAVMEKLNTMDREELFDFMLENQIVWDDEEIEEEGGLLFAAVSYVKDHLEICPEVKDLIDNDKLKDFVENQYDETETIGKWLENADPDGRDSYIDYISIARSMTDQPERYMNTVTSVYGNKGYYAGCSVDVSKIEVKKAPTVKKTMTLDDKLKQAAALRNENNKSINDMNKDIER